MKQEWQRDDYNYFRRGLTQARRDKDDAALQKAFAGAADIPVFRQALDWAQEHGIEFFVDRTCTKHVGAYYMPRVGAVGVNQRALQNPQMLAAYLTHELRHASQDVNGLLGNAAKPDYAAEAIRTALIEADAMAFETLAAHQAARAALRKRAAEQGLPPDLATRLKRLEKYCENEKADLWRGFRNWFETQRPYFYGSGVAKREAAAFGMPGITPPDHKYELNAYLPAEAVRPAVDIADRTQFQKLGKTFSGGNYLNDKQRRDFVLTTVNSPSLARSFWRAGAKPPQLMNELRLQELRIKTEEAVLTFTADGAEGDIDALKDFLGKRFGNATGVKNIDHKVFEGVVLETTVTYRRGLDQAAAFKAVARQIKGWQKIAPGVGVIDMTMKSEAIKGGAGHSRSYGRRWPVTA